MYKFTGSWEEESLKIEVVDIYPIYHAHGMAFDGKYDFDYNYALDKGYELDEFRIGLLHSHSNTGVFFSNPDMEELKANANHHPFYISLITNNRGEWCGKVCIEQVKEVTQTGIATFRNTFGDIVKKNFKETETVKNYIIFDCDMQYSLPEVDDLFSNKVDEIIKNKKQLDAQKAVKKYNSGITANYDYNTLYKDAFDNKVWTKEIGWFFSTVDMDLETIVNSEHYTTDLYGPDTLIQYMENCQYTITDELVENLLEEVIKMFEGCNTSFSKKLIKEYNEYIKEFVTSKV